MSASGDSLANRARWPTVGALALLLAMAGCSSTGSLFRSSGDGSNGSTNGSDTAAGDTATLDARNVAVYLDTMARLIEGDTLTQAAIFNDLADAAEFAPTTTNRLLYALALSLPDHSGSDPAAAAERLRGLIAAGNTLLPEERMLAQIQLQSANELAILRAASAESEARLASGLAARDEQHAAALAAQMAEIERLETELKDVTATLDAITNIERSLSEREDNE
jgi:hypothetical protein